MLRLHHLHSTPRHWLCFSPTRPSAVRSRWSLGAVTGAAQALDTARPVDPHRGCSQRCTPRRRSGPSCRVCTDQRARRRRQRRHHRSDRRRDHRCSDRGPVVEELAFRGLLCSELDGPRRWNPTREQLCGHRRATDAQNAATICGSYGDEVLVAEDALKAAGVSPTHPALSMREARLYFENELGLTEASPLRAPCERNCS